MRIYNDEKRFQVCFLNKKIDIQWEYTESSLLKNAMLQMQAQISQNLDTKASKYKCRSQDS